MYSRSTVAISFVSSMILLNHPSIAAADVFLMDEYALTENSTIVFDDSFDRNLNLVGGSGTILSSGTTFSDGSPADYIVHGSFSETTANGGQAILNPANGIISIQPPPFLPAVQHVSNTLQTFGALTPSLDFSTTGLFELSAPALNNETYDVYLTSGSASTAGNNVELRVRNIVGSPVLQFVWEDKANPARDVIDQIPITSADLTNPEVELQLSHAAGSNDITASYAFGSGNTLSSFNGVLATLGSTDSSTDVFNPISNFVRGGFETFAPVVPESSTWSMMLLGFAGLGFAGFRASRKEGRARLLSRI